MIAIIPARGGSKRVLGKNVRAVHGVPLIARAIRAAKNASRVSLVYVSTDDRRIAEVAIDEGATVVPRPPELCTDGASSESALLHTLNAIEESGGITDAFAFLQCTCPFTLPEWVDETLGMLSDFDTALTVAPFHAPLWRRTDSGAYGINHDKAVRLRSQDWPPQYIETGAVYAMRTAGFREHRHRFFGRTGLCVTPADRLLDIDTEHDLFVANAMDLPGENQ